MPRKQKVCAEDGPSGAGQVVVAQDVATQDAAMQHAARRSELGVLLANAIKDEDFMEAHRIKQLLAETAADPPEVAAKPSPAASSSAGASEPRATCLVPVVASSDEVHLQADFLPLREVVSQGAFQASADIPTHAGGKRLEMMLQCSVCRMYWAKTQTELDRHVSHNHGAGLKQSQAAPEPVDVSIFTPYALHGAAAVAAATTKRKRSEMEGEDEPVPDAIEAPAVDVGGGCDANALCRKPAAQHTPEDIKDMCPLRGERVGVGIYVDRLRHHRFTAKYPNDRILKYTNPERVRDLPDEFRRSEKTFSFGSKGTDAQQEAALEAALEWLWGKLAHFFPSDSRPAYTRP